MVDQCFFARGRHKYDLFDSRGYGFGDDRRIQLGLAETWAADFLIRLQVPAAGWSFSRRDPPTFFCFFAPSALVGRPPGQDFEG